LILYSFIYFPEDVEVGTEDVVGAVDLVGLFVVLVSTVDA
jgi:hypothetical protein